MTWWRFATRSVPRSWLETSGLSPRSSSQVLGPNLVEIRHQVSPEFRGTSTSCTILLTAGISLPLQGYWKSNRNRAFWCPEQYRSNSKITWIPVEAYLKVRLEAGESSQVFSHWLSGSVYKRTDWLTSQLEYLLWTISERRKESFSGVISVLLVWHTSFQPHLSQLLS